MFHERQLYSRHFTAIRDEKRSLFGHSHLCTRADGVAGLESEQNIEAKSLEIVKKLCKESKIYKVCCKLTLIMFD